MNKKDFKWTEKRFGTTFANILKKLGGLSKDGTDGSIEYKDDDGNVSKLVTDSTFGSLLAKNGLIEVKWQELKDKRNNGQLIPGSLYRITDYNCTTTQEDTQSAGHQFDIVLLALSENKLAEEGWAMEHPTDIYDVTFYVGFTKKCYLYVTSISEDDGKIYESWNLIDIDTMLGVQLDDVVRGESASIDDNNKQVSFRPGAVDPSIFALDTPNLTYNYFQNSNLSAWKVWYCLDNDKSRFAWADDNLPSIVDEDTIYVRKPSSDIGDLFAWYNENDNIYDYTKTEHPSIGDETFDEEGGTNAIVSNVFGFGRGVIYRLIDEFNNDCPYDFKNIQFVRQLDSNGRATNQGAERWVFTFSLYNIEDDELLDASLNYPKFVNDEGGWHIHANNKICRIYSYNDGGDEPLYDTAVNRQCLNDTVFTIGAINHDRAPYIKNNVILTAYNCSFPDVVNLVLLYAVNRNYNTYIYSLDYSIIYEDKKCTLERLS